MKIAVLTHDVNVSAGWGRFSDQLISGLRERGHDVLVISERGGAHPVLRRGIGVLWSVVRLLPLIRTVDIVHAMDVYPFGAIAWLATRIIRKPIIFSAQGTYSIAPLEVSRYRLLYRVMTRRVDRVLAISQYTADRLTGALGSSCSISVIHHGVDLERWRIDVSTGLQRDQAVISVGSVKFRKGYHVAIRAFSEARKSFPSLQWWIVGSTRDKGYIEKLKKLADSLGVTDAIHWYENVSDDELRRLYSRASVFMLLSQNQGAHFEGFGLVFLEAAACGLPVIGTRDNGIQEAISDANGILVPQDDSAAARDAIVLLLSHEAIRRSMGEASVRWAKSHSIDSVIDEYELQYKEVIA
ncbi:MAG: glycosyltransferase family 4 protein [Candidatus Pacebacteria bacterium]|nr:glycosyltransferase family 4 protein [Candidatus Paceibacterota bacterium]